MCLDDIKKIDTHIKKKDTHIKKKEELEVTLCSLLQTIRRLQIIIDEGFRLDKEEIAAKEIAIVFDQVLDREIDDFEMSVRANNVLKKGLGVKTMRNVVVLKGYQLRQTPNCGKRTVKEIETLLGSLGLSLEMKLSLKE